MARAQDPNSAGSQFFIMHADAPYLDGQYAAFGKITEGLDVLDRIADVKTNFMDAPWEPQVIESIVVESHNFIKLAAGCGDSAADLLFFYALVCPALPRR